PGKSQPRTLDLRRMTTTPTPPRSTAPAASELVTTVSLFPLAVSGTPVSGAPWGTLSTWPGDVAAGAADGGSVAWPVGFVD
ncbi:hypothetical protein, partial [Actinacidiphila oryziradicis]|uniref:hypothetical protein n=1 Tax=Actinacidiphila oryziradicis TaxID=2571141 RepID=UPI0023F44EC7